MMDHEIISFIINFGNLFLFMYLFGCFERKSDAYKDIEMEVKYNLNDGDKFILDLIYLICVAILIYAAYEILNIYYFYALIGYTFIDILKKYERRRKIRE